MTVQQHPASPRTDFRSDIACPAARAVRGRVRNILLAGCLGLLGVHSAIGRTEAAPEPVALDPAITAIVSQVSRDSLFSHVQTLQAFHTRNTASDTVSTTTGIGAARRWVHDHFGSNSGVAADYFDWDGEICTVDRTNRSVLGTMTGSLHPDRFLVVGAHLDSRTTDTCNLTAFAPGANDDASGVGCLLELARLVSTLEPERTIVLQAFTGEEQGLAGSTAFAREAHLSGMQIDAMINNDIIGNIDGCPGEPDCNNGPTTHEDSLSIRVFSDGPNTSAARQLARLNKLIGEAYVDEMTVHMIPLLDRAGRGGDHIPFDQFGFPAVRFIETLEYTLQQHNAADLIGQMEFSYFQRNVMINTAVLANLALAPLTPTGVQVYDLGTGGGIRAEWDPVSGDVAGYRVAYRYVDQGDTLFYADIVDAGTSLSFDVTGLSDDVPLAVSVSAYDAEGHESVFSTEGLVTPGIAPHLVPGVAVISKPDRIRLEWNEPQELDLTRFRIYRSLNPVSGFSVRDSVSAGTNFYDDVTAQAGVPYYYKVSSVDVTGLESPLTPSDKGLRRAPQYGILLVDATRDGNGGIGSPSDSQADAYYTTLFAGRPVLGTWDFPAQLAAGVLLTDADMGQYRTVWIHSDLRNGKIAADSLEIRQYLDNGGQVFLGGWGLEATFSGSLTEFGIYPAGTFFHDVLKADSLRTALGTESDFRGAVPLVGGYPNLLVDATKYPFSGGNLTFMDALVGAPLPGGTPIYEYDSSFVPPGASDGLVNGVRIGSGPAQVIWATIPLYFMQQAGASAFVNRALIDFGYGTTDAPEPDALAQISLGVAPNPFSSRTELSFALPRAEDVSIGIYDVAGRLVRELSNGRFDAGDHTVIWDGENGRGDRMPASVYFAGLRVGDRWITREITILR